MGSISTPTALVLKGPFSAESRQYPIWAYMEALVPWFDKAEHDATGIEEFYAKDFSFLTPHADHIESIGGHGEGHAFNTGAPKIYTEPLKEFKHENTVLIAFESGERWDVYCQMSMYANVEGTPMKDEPKVTDDGGREWEVEIPLFYHLQVVKDSNAKHSGLKMKHVTMIKDTGIVNDKLDERGVGHKRSVNAA